VPVLRFGLNVSHKGFCSYGKCRFIYCKSVLTDAPRPIFSAIYQALMVTMYVAFESNKYYILGCDFMQSGRSLLTFQRNVLLLDYCLCGLLFDHED
jgi:hypothetical protein